MRKITIAPDQASFLKDGKPFFYLADTIWSAFTSITDEEWEYYLNYRAQQKFNVLQINILPQWDRCWSPCNCTPFPMKSDGVFAFDGEMNEAYFMHAKKMCKMAVDKGFQLALVVLWSNFVPGTWASRIIDDNIMPKTLIPSYCKKVAEVFNEFEPIYIISGDTDFDDEETVEYYRLALNEMKKNSPDTLKTMHIKGRYTYLPKYFAQNLDFYMFQTGHNSSFPEKPYTMPTEFETSYPKKPLLNAEPCYEQMGYSGNKYGRFDQFAIRRAAWMSILSGASAGITYGAHGVWNWQQIGRSLNPAMGEGFDAAKPWQEALHFSGAWDYSFIHTLLEEKNVRTLVPQKVILNHSEEIRMAATPDGRVSFIYAPHNTEIKVSMNLDGYKVSTIDLETNHVASPQVEVLDDDSILSMCPFAKDILVVIEKNEVK